MITLLLVGGSVVAQTAGKLRFIVDPGGNYSFVLDHQFRMQQREVELSAGPHHFTFWAPERRMVDTTIMVVENRTKDVTIYLPYSAEYRAYDHELHAMKKRNWLHMVLPSAATLGAGVLMGTSFVKYKAANDQLKEDEQAYRSGSDPRSLQQLKDVVIPSHKSDFKDRQGVFYITTGLFALVAAGSAWVVVRNAKRSVPKFNDAERVKFDGLVWMPSPQGGGYWLTGLHINLR
jgi:hypothetical protein